MWAFDELWGHIKDEPNLYKIIITFVRVDERVWGLRNFLKNEKIDFEEIKTSIWSIGWKEITRPCFYFYMDKNRILEVMEITGGDFYNTKPKCYFIEA